MKKTLVLCIVIVLMESFTLSAQETWSNGKALNLPFKKYGISIGNSYEFNGIRLNFADKDVEIIRGLNVTLWLKMRQNQKAVVKGISLGLVPTAGTMWPINLGILGTGAAHNLYGLTMGGLVVGAGGNIKGLSVSGLFTEVDGVSGIALSGLFLFSGKTINGVALAGLTVGSDNADINGVASSLAHIFCKNTFRGTAVTTGYMKINILKGIAIAGYAKTNQMHGLSIALFNKTKELHGIQFGLINYAGNNPKGLRALPFVNLHLRKNQNINKKDE